MIAVKSAQSKSQSGFTKDAQTSNRLRQLMWIGLNKVVAKYMHGY